MDYFKQLFYAIKQICRLVKRILLFWGVCCVFSFLSMIPIGILGYPTNLPLPWSMIADFIEGSENKLFIMSRFYGRILCYDINGRFLGSHLCDSRSSNLSVGKNGDIYYRTADRLYVCDDEMQVKEKTICDVDGDYAWKLDAAGTPVCTKLDEVLDFTARRPMAKGDYIFTTSSKGNDIFQCTDGTILRREGNKIRRYKDRELIAEYKQPLIFSFISFPFPAALGLLIIFVWLVIKDKKKTKKKEKQGQAI